MFSLDYYATAGMIVVALIAVFGLFIFIKKNINNDRKLIEELNIQD